MSLERLQLVCGVPGVEGGFGWGVSVVFSHRCSTSCGVEGLVHSYAFSFLRFSLPKTLETVLKLLFA